MLCCSVWWAETTAWCESYDTVQTCAIVLLYLQVLCALIGSLGAVYTGIVLANLVLALFALIAIESGSQTLGRAYAGLLAFALLLDIIWFILFTSEIWHFGNNSEVGKIGAFYLEITFWMQATGSGLRILSSFLWIQMYRLGVASDTVAAYQPIDFDGRIGGFSLFHSNSPTPVANARQTSMSDEVLGGSIYNPAAYASLFERLDNDTYLDIESASSGGVSKDILYTPPRSSSLNNEHKDVTGWKPASDSALGLPRSS
ncbi:hypothetical protein CY35_18G046200 [Sphagnum magellanicum]|jgi:hypothetical protein|nr:hypothetical protein CY35_18G046200 [Sphagnum magellanicum]KAH9533335.1 hypothetical protein CY35_18G046200 [Sphagnum magellanicum]KAH9533336.1 hypothetical protein CY35_18G046200 [Sphagnum magellanicum]